MVEAIEKKRDPDLPKPKYEPNDDTAQLRREEKLQILQGHIEPKTLDVLKAIGAMKDIEDAVMPIITDDGDADCVFPVLENWVDTEIEVTLDSGCCEHVMDIADAPGYGAYIMESSGSRRRQNFIVGNGQKVPNEGQIMLNLEAGAGDSAKVIRSTFQVAEISRPLMSVGRVCDLGFNCVFTMTDAKVVDSSGAEVVKFVRQGGLYVAT